MQADPRFDEMFQTHLDAVQRYCLRRLPSEEASDAVAEVFLVAWRKIDDAPAGAELPWLYGIARNVVRNAHRAGRRQRSLRDRIDGERPNVEPSPEMHVVRSDDHRMVLQALDALRPPDQEILRLKTWEGLSNGEIATALGISSHAVDMRLSRARDRLAREYARRERFAQGLLRSRGGRRT